MCASHSPVQLERNEYFNFSGDPKEAEIFKFWLSLFLKNLKKLDSVMHTFFGQGVAETY